MCSEIEHQRHVQYVFKVLTRRNIEHQLSVQILGIQMLNINNVFSICYILGVQLVF